MVVHDTPTTDYVNGPIYRNGLKRMYQVDTATLAANLGTWSAGAGPLNEQLADAIAGAIERGALAPGTRLPAERALAAQLGLSRTTIVGAYDRLRAADLVRSRQGSGTRVASRSSDPSTAHAAARPGLLEPYLVADSLALSAGVRGPRDGHANRSDQRHDDSVISMTLAALRGWTGIREVIEQAMREDLPDLLHDFGYQPYGLPSLRAAIASYLTSTGLPTVAAEVLVTSGAQQAIAIIADHLVGRDGVVAIEDPTYVGAVDAFRSSAARMVPVPVGPQGIRLDLLRQVLDTASPAFIYVVPTFQNPTGALMPAEARRELAALAASRGVMVVEDLTPELGQADQVPPPIGASAVADGVVTVGSLSKGGWAGLRIGWIRAERALIDRLAARKTVMDHGVSVLSQAAAVRLLARVGSFGEHAERESQVRRSVAATALRELLPTWTWTEPVGGLCYWVRLPHGDAVAFTRVAAEHGVIVRPGPVASAHGGFRDHLRIAVGDDPERVREGFVRLAVAWADFDSSDAYQETALSVSV